MRKFSAIKPVVYFNDDDDRSSVYCNLTGLYNSYHLPGFVSSLRFGLAAGLLDDLAAVKINDVDPRTHNFLRYGREAQTAIIISQHFSLRMRVMGKLTFLIMTDMLVRQVLQFIFRNLSDSVDPWISVLYFRVSTM